MARILIVDDDEMERLLARTILEKLGHELYMAEDGEDALEIFRAEDIDVVVTDMVMPHVDGLSFIREIRRMDAGVEVIAVSGVSSDELGLAHELGAFATLAKPVDPEKLVEAVNAAVKRSQSQA
jgi:CheY-like chemotaxis protein